MTEDKYKAITRGYGNVYPAPATRFVFNSTTEFGEALHTIGPRQYGADSASDKPQDDMWDGGLTLSRAIDMARSGSPWPEGIAAMQPIDLSDIEIDGSLQRHTPTLNAAVHGFAPIVPAFLAGVPESMLTMEDQSAPEPAIRVAVSFIHSASTSSKAILNRGAAMLSVIDALELSGRRVEIWGVYRVASGDVCASLEVCVKHSGEHWDPGAVAFMLAHPASGRRCGFRFLESQPGCAPVASGGYGYGHGIDMSDFDCHFPYMMGDDGYRSPAASVKSVAAKFRAVIEQRKRDKAA